jgi:hypothetical protein
MFDSKSIAADIVKGEKALTGGGEVEPEASPKKLAAEDILAAFQANDPDALAAALDSFMAGAEASEPPEADEAVGV